MRNVCLRKIVESTFHFRKAVNPPVANHGMTKQLLPPKSTVLSEKLLIANDGRSSGNESVRRGGVYQVDLSCRLFQRQNSESVGAGIYLCSN